MNKFIKIFFMLIMCQNVINAEEVALIKEGGVYSVPVMINKSIKLNFVVDSGAARVSMPYDVFRTLMRTGTIKKNDILGTEKYTMANGDTEEAIKINIRTMKIGNENIYNVLASVDRHMNGMLLLGQSALEQLEPWHLDTSKRILYINRHKEREDNKGSKYIVKMDDSLFKIAKKYHTTIDSIRKTNNLTKGTTIKVGDILSIVDTEQIKNKKKIYTNKNHNLSLGNLMSNNVKTTYYMLAEQCYKQSNYQCAFNYSEQQLNEDLNKYSLLHEQIAKDYNQLGYYANLLGNYNKSLDYYFKSLKIKEKILDKNDISTAGTYNNVGLTYYRQSKYKKALSYYFKALKIQENVLGKNDIKTAGTYNNIGLTYNKQSRYDEALVYTAVALKIAQKVLGENHEKTAKSYNNLADIYRVMGKNKIALKNYFKAMKIQEKLLGKNHPDTAITYNNIGLVYNSQKKYKEALQYINKALIIVSNKLGDNHPTSKIIKTNLTEIETNKALAKFKK